ncbi:helix-turn-helix transcriptional regulator [Vibrio penaeicida]|uniref:helix-turn-helix transcriptional regulator n=1 Tax=Vibrio penaeicida TaxID=104609 RepID=UPI000CEA2BC6|nr:AraC family transcriptional regulator [Vibrio penaeicida]
MNGFYRFQFDHIEMFETVAEKGYYGLNESFGSLEVNRFNLDEGLHSMRMQGKFSRPVELFSSDGFGPREITVFVSTGSCCECYLQSLGERFLISPNKVAIYYSDDVSGYTRAQNSLFQGVSVNISIDQVRSLVESYQCKDLEHYFSPAFQNQPKPFLFTFDANESMMAIARQMLSSSANNLAETLQFRGLGWHLFSLVLQEMSPSNLQSGKLSPADIHKIYSAKNLLMERMDAPPSLIELAQEVGLNDFKLKLGFKEVFQQTAFGYLHQQRMERAREILLEQRSNVIRVANEVGYQNHGHFSVAFKKHFGITPSDYLKLTQ